MIDAKSFFDVARCRRREVHPLHNSILRRLVSLKWVDTIRMPYMLDAFFATISGHDIDLILIRNNG